jgi:hypothetical protein
MRANQLPCGIESGWVRLRPAVNPGPERLRVGTEEHKSHGTAIPIIVDGRKLNRLREAQ